MNNSPQPPADDTAVERQLQDYFAQVSHAAQGYDPDPSALWQRVAPALTPRNHVAPPSVRGTAMSNDLPNLPAAPGALARRPFIPIAAALLVVALVSSVFVFARAPHGKVPVAAVSPTPTGPVGKYCPNTTPIAHYMPLPPVTVPSGGTASDNGITIHIDHVYADATQTLIYYNLRLTHRIKGLAGDIDIYATLTDERGKVYQILQGGDPDGTSTNPLYLNGWFFSAAPFAPEDLGHPHLLTLTVNGFENFYQPPPGTPTPTPLQRRITGFWQIHMPVTPTAKHSILFHQPAVVHCGIGVRVLSLDITSGGYAPLGVELQGSHGGARFELEFSGLPAITDLETLASFAFGSGDISQPGSYSSSSAFTISVNGGEPGNITIPGLDMATGSPTVGAGGTARLDIIFYSPLPMTGQPLVIDINKIALVNGGRYYAPGPWHIELPTH